jgi:phosphatidyl-myo-inositol dimannoside synthase
MKMVHLLTHEFRPKRGGAGVVCEQMAETLARCGFKTSVWVPEYARDISRAQSGTASFPIRIIDGLRGTRDPSCLMATWRWMQSNRALFANTILHAVEPGPLEVLLWWVGLGKPPFWHRLVITLHGSELVRYIRNPILRFWFRRLLSHTSRVHVLSIHNRELLLKHFPEVKNRCVCGFGILLPGETLEHRMKDLHARTPESAKFIRILCVGRIHPRKGQVPLLEAVALLPVSLQERVAVEFAGQVVKGAYHKKLLTLIRKCRCSVIFRGGISDRELQQAYRDADVFALTSMPSGSSVEGLGLVYLEAAMHGLPALGHTIGGVSDAVIHKTTGLLSDWRDRKALAANLERLILDDALRERLGSQGRARVSQCFWEPVIRNLFAD